MSDGCWKNEIGRTPAQGGVPQNTEDPFSCRIELCNALLAVGTDHRVQRSFEQTAQMGQFPPSAMQFAIARLSGLLRLDVRLAHISPTASSSSVRQQLPDLFVQLVQAERLLQHRQASLQRAQCRGMF